MSAYDHQLQDNEQAIEVGVREQSVSLPTENKKMDAAIVQEGKVSPPVTSVIGSG